MAAWLGAAGEGRELKVLNIVLWRINLYSAQSLLLIRKNKYQLREDMELDLY